MFQPERPNFFISSSLPDHHCSPSPPPPSLVLLLLPPHPLFTVDRCRSFLHYRSHESFSSLLSFSSIPARHSYALTVSDTKSDIWDLRSKLERTKDESAVSFVGAPAVLVVGRRFWWVRGFGHGREVLVVGGRSWCGVALGCCCGGVFLFFIIFF